MNAKIELVLTTTHCDQLQMAGRNRMVLMAMKLVVLVLVLALTEARISPSLRVQLTHGGWLIGRHLTTHHGRGMRAFMGVPYAVPPLGDLRFQAPTAEPGWQGDRMAVEDAPKCMQRDPFRRDTLIEGTEDCLYLNVYTPSPPASNASGGTVMGLPVMIWFHGGGWQCGSGVSSFYGPDFLLDHDIILVSANFRLGPLGFLSTETLDCPGNAGLKDQLEVLRWVRDNIARFGGNPESVTIFGESAGGASVTYHMLSEQSRGLFHRGIAQSGTYFNPWAQPAHAGVAAQRAKKLTQLVGCAQSEEADEAIDWPTKLACLRNSSAESIVATVYDMFLWDYDPMIPFPPVVEPLHKDAFLSVLPREASHAPHGFALPLMVGATSEEGLLKTAALLNMPHLLDEFKARFEDILPIVLYYDHHPVEMQQLITKRIESFYLKSGHDYDNINHHNITDVMSDGWFIAGIDEYLRLRLANQQQQQQQQVAPTFAYLFVHKGAASFSELFKGGRNEFYGACHAEELQYLFPIAKELFVSAVPTRKDLELRELLLQWWVNFARTGNPNSSPLQSNDRGGGHLLPTWPPATEYPVSYARIGSNIDDEDDVLMRIEQGLLQQRSDFWHHLNPHLPSASAGQSQKTTTHHEL